MDRLFTILVSLAIFCLTSLVAPSQIQITQDKNYKLKAKPGRVIVRDKSKPVRRALEEQYAKIAEATRRKDLAPLLALRTPDFSVRTPNGETWSYQRAADYIKAGFDQVETIIDMRFDISTINLQGNEAAAIIHQRWSRMQVKQGKLRRVETTAVQRETWLKTLDGWRLKLIDDIHPGEWYVDGRRVDPSKPYDPDAPAFEPKENR